MTKKQLFDIFEEITDSIISVDLTKDRDEVIRDVTELIKKRTEIINQIDELEEEFEDNELFNRLLQKNQQIEVELHEILLLIKDEITGIINEKSLSSKKKKAIRGYMNLGHQKDGYFIDKKK